MRDSRGVTKIHDKPFQELFGQSPCSVFVTLPLFVEKNIALSPEQFDLIPLRYCHALSGFTLGLNFPSLLSKLLALKPYCCDQPYEGKRPGETGKGITDLIW